MKSKIISIKNDYALLLSSVPTLLTVTFVLSVIVMNLLANKIVFQAGDVLVIDGGYLISWIPFLCMDCLTKRYGARAAIMLNILSAVFNILCVLVFSFVSWLPGNGEDYSAFDSIFSGVWFIILGSMVAYVVSGAANSLVNEAVGKIFKGRYSFFLRSYVSTFVGQIIDNFLFYFIVYFTFAPKYWGWGLSLELCATSAIVCGVIELGVEALFSPIGYLVVKKWESNNTGSDWLNR